jgi:hypothetical protein
MTFQQWRESWIEVLAGKHPNSCRNQIIQNCQLATFYATITEMGKRGGKDLAVNGQLMQMFVLGYVTRQANAIRRLVDSKRNRQGEFDVMSLGRVVHEMIENQSLLTRANMVGFDGTPVDTKAAWIAYSTTVDVERAIANPSATGDQLLLQRWSDSERRNNVFDRISEMPADRVRRGTDLVSMAVLEKFKAAMQGPSIKRVKKFVDKLVAHADDSIDLTGPDIAVSMSDLKDSLRVLAQLQAFLLGPVFDHLSGTLVPVPQYPHLDHLEKPLVPPEQMEHAMAIWREKANEIDAWASEDGRFEQFYADHSPTLTNKN